ncbi:hypothetical protein BA768_12010 [Chryseobacterium sp. CBo1]|uniref:hypothetical protein n=1 Tax=Chryseobacterium sp. CBo1 TaxID=1869230 RepID=UPI000810627E|nr:hypothetical protein [Chryseobacterium sp. CBo1]OCK52571.1 hypothetical protein BA768_12010 [Chryseobacterium sp. CBo1]
MSKIILLTLLFHSLIFQSQKLENGLQFRKNEKSDQKLSFEEKNRTIYNVLPIEKSEDLVNVRILFPGQIIELAKSKDNKYFGYILNKTTQYNYSRRDRNKLKNTVEFFQKYPLKQKKTKEVIDKLIQTNQINLPTDSLIENWNRNYLHCNQINFQFKILNNLQKQQYNCPLHQNEEKQTVKIIAENIRFVQNQLKLDSIYKNFESNLPSGKNYSNDGYRMMLKLSKKQIEIWQKYKPYREYLKLKKDTVDNYLNTFIQNKNLNPYKINCFETYYLEFAKKGNLKKIFVANYDKPRWENVIGFKDFLQDKREIKKCKKIIKEIFLKADLSWLNLKFNLNRSISFDLDGNPKLSDEAIYEIE